MVGEVSGTTPVGAGAIRAAERPVRVGDEPPGEASRSPFAESGARRGTERDPVAAKLAADHPREDLPEPSIRFRPPEAADEPPFEREGDPQRPARPANEASAGPAVYDDRGLTTAEERTGKLLNVLA